MTAKTADSLTAISDPFGMVSDSRLVQNRSFINGVWVEASDNQSVHVTNPANDELLGSLSALNKDQAKHAVDAAHDAFPAWSSLLPQERASILSTWYDMICQNREDLAVLMTLEQGKPISEARGEIDYAASFVEFYAEESKRPNIENVTSHLHGAEMEVWREPCGVAALITPWNFPAAMLTRKASAALAAGCTVVCHPSRETPYSALALAVLAERAGFPPGVFNVVTGHASQLVPVWTSDPRVRVLSFTGSTDTGQLLYRESAATIKRLVLELGGHAPFIVFPDANLDQVIDCAISAKFATSGQDCLGANRFFIHRSIYPEFSKEFTKRVKMLSVGFGLDDPDIGPLMNEQAIAKQVAHVADALEKGATLLTGGKQHALGKNFFEPTVLADVSSDALIFREETFGPIAALSTFDEEDEVITQANDTEYGLVAYLHTEDPGRIYRMSRALQFGMIAVNRTKVTGAPIPFGGMKQSGMAREGSRYGMEAYMDIKFVCRNWA